MELNGIMNLKLREVLSLTEQKFSVLYEFQDSEYNRIVFETPKLQISDYDYSKETLIIYSSNGGISCAFQFELEQEYALDINLFACSLDGASEYYSVPYTSEYCTVYIENKDMSKRLIDMLFEQEVTVDGGFQ